MPSASEPSPWLTIWLQPRATMRGLFDSTPARGFWLLCLLFGLPQYYQHASQSRMGDTHPYEQVWLWAFALGPLVGWGQILFWSWLLKHSGRWLKGEGSPERVRSAVAWATLPIGSLTFVWWALIGKYGIDLFRRDAPSIAADPATAALHFKVALTLIVVMVLWSTCLLVNTLSVAHQFSRGRSLAAIALGILAFMVPLFLAALAISLVPASLSPPISP